MRITGLDSGPFFAKAAPIAEDTTTVVAAVTGKKIRVLSYTIQGVTLAGTAVFTSAATAISGVIATVVLVPFGESNPYGLFETVAGEALRVTMATATATSSVRVTYALIGS